MKREREADSEKEGGGGGGGRGGGGRQREIDKIEKLTKVYLSSSKNRRWKLENVTS